MTHFYIYYKVDPSQVARAGRAALGVLDAVRASTGAVGRLLRRGDDPHTWMEIYENVAAPEALEAAINAAVAAHDFDAILVRGTHRVFERFVPFDPRCA